MLRLNGAAILPGEPQDASPDYCVNVQELRLRGKAFLCRHDGVFGRACPNLVFDQFHSTNLPTQLPDKLELMLATRRELLLRFRHFHHPWRSHRELLLRFRHFHHPWRSHVANNGEMRAEGSALDDKPAP